MSDEQHGRHRDVWNDWVVRACEAADVDPTLVDIDQILAMTKEVAHRFERPMAPVSSFILGVAAASGRDLTELRTLIEATLPAQEGSAE